MAAYSGFTAEMFPEPSYRGSNPGRSTRLYPDPPKLVSQRIMLSAHNFELYMLRTFSCMTFMNFTIVFST
jgi:hypothetical protein